MPSIRTLMRTLLVLVCAQLAMFAGTVIADPPARVARLAYVQGPVSFAPAGEDEWVVATPNRPLVAGDRVWADPAARTELQVGSAVLRFGASTSATVLNLDDRIAQFEVTEGSVNINARRLAPNEVVEIDTPNLALTIRRPGVYRIEVDANGDSTAVSVRRGEAEVYGEGAAYVIPTGQFYRFYATGLQQRQYAALPAPDEFDQWAASRDQQYDASVAARYVAPEVIGYQDLDQYGTWSSVPEYGNVWIPNRVAADWAPYRDGRWSWIEPWGWTWVDAEPWGFAPYHYGRWAYVGDRWGWVPGPRTVRPVYAPALVAFVGGPNFSVSVSAGSAAPVGWFPLAPGEVYLPSYRVSREYFNRVNVTNTVINTTVVNNYYNNNNVANIAYRNRQARAITAVPADVFAQSRPVRGAAVQVATVDMSKLQVAMAPPVAPTRASVLAAAQAPHRAADQVQRREVVAKTKPAPTQSPFQSREQALAKQAGRQHDSSAVASAAPAAKTDERRVRVMTAERRPEPAPKTSAGAPGKGEAPVAAQGGAPVPGLPTRQEAGKTREEAQQAARQQQEQQRAQQQEQQKAQQAGRQQQQEQQKAQQATRQQQQEQQRAQQQEQQKGQQAARQQQDQQKAQQAARQQQQQEQQKAQQSARQQQQDQQRAQQQEQQKAQQAARQQQQQEQQRAQQAARQQQQQEQQKAQQAARQQQDQARAQQQEQQRAQQAARQQQQQEQQKAQQAARQQQQEQQKAQQAARQQQQQQQEQQKAQQAARQQQQQEQQRAQQERARQAPPAAKGKDKDKDEDKQAKG